MEDSQKDNIVYNPRELESWEKELIRIFTRSAFIDNLSLADPNTNYVDSNTSKLDSFEEIVNDEFKRIIYSLSKEIRKFEEWKMPKPTLMEKMGIWVERYSGGFFKSGYLEKEKSHTSYREESLQKLKDQKMGFEKGEYPKNTPNVQYSLPYFILKVSGSRDDVIAQKRGKLLEILSSVFVSFLSTKLELELGTIMGKEETEYGFLLVPNSIKVIRGILNEEPNLAARAKAMEIIDDRDLDVSTTIRSYIQFSNSHRTKEFKESTHYRGMVAEAKSQMPVAPKDIKVSIDEVEKLAKIHDSLRDKGLEEEESKEVLTKIADLIREIVANRINEDRQNRGRPK